MAILENRVKKYKSTPKRLFKSNALTVTNFFNFISLISILVFIFNFNSSYVQSTMIDTAGYFNQYFVNPLKNNVLIAFKTASSIFQYQTLYSENLSLKIENERLKTQAKKALILAEENKRIKSSFNIAENYKNLVAHSEIIMKSSDNNSEFAMISGGQKSGINLNNIVISNGNLLGRIVTVGQNYSKLLLVNSYKSRIPVKTFNTGMLAILVGCGDNKGYLLHANGRQKPKEGELVVTSGNGEFYPARLPVARITKVYDDKFEVIFLENLSSTNFVDVVDPKQL